MTSPALEALVGRVLDGHYRLDALLGAGGMGAVYRAEHTGLRRSVAIKVLHPDVGADPSIAKRFDREATSASRLDHPHCVRVTDFGATDDGVKYLVMELLEGAELGAFMGQPWAPERACELLTQILAGLEHAHHHGIVHRDLKPENVFITRDDQGRESAKLVDFGIAKLLDDEGAAEVLTRAGMVFGTPRYMSPEQAAGGKIDARCDLYAVGVLAFEMLSGAPPFDSEDLAAILRMQIIAPPPDLTADVPARLVAWVGSLLEKSRHQRPESAAAARAALVELQTALRERSPTTPAAPDPDGGNPTAPSRTLALDPGARGPLHATAPFATQGADDPLPSRPKAMVGHRVAGRYRIDALLGIGGMGAVFRATDEAPGESSGPNPAAPVAVKILHAALAADDEMAARFEREAKTASALVHPHIVPVLAHGTTPGVGGQAHYLIMPLLEGRELRELCGVPMAVPRAAQLSLQLLDALGLAHAHGVIHRDLKPENVFIEDGPGGVELVRLVDFGLAKVAAGSRSYRALTRFGQVFGTPAYMSPEQCRGEVVDARTDVYAVGIILHELLCGRPPFAADNALVLLGLQVHDPPPPLPEHVPPAIAQFVIQLLSKDRDPRPANGAAAAAGLRAALAVPFEPFGPSSTPAPAAPAPAASAPSSPASSASASASLAQPAASAAPTLPAIVQPDPPASPSSSNRRRRAWLIGGGVALALVVLVALLPNSRETSTTADRPTAPPAEVYVEIDRLLSAKASDAALEEIRANREAYPEDAALIWREGRALALGDSSDRAAALGRYVDAVEANPALADETEFAAQLRTLLGDPKLREVAIDVAIRELDHAGHTLAHSFLLEVINDDQRTPSYGDRQRILAVLEADPDTRARIHMQRQRELDIRQAGDALAPCAAFMAALDAIEDSDDPAHLELLFDDDISTAIGPGAGETLDDCVELGPRQIEVRDALAAHHPEAAAQAGKPKPKSRGGSGSKKKKSGFKLPF